jgi:hypothetical protein
MLIKMQLKYLAIIIAITGTCFLYYVSTFAQPTIIELHQIPEYEGKQVTVEGTVIEHHLTSYKGHIIEINDNNNSKTTIYVEEETTVDYGDTIQATGIVQKYKGEWEIVVDNKRFVKIIQKWNDTRCPLWQLAENPNRYVGMNVNVTGIIDRWYDAFFYLIDSEDEHSVIVSCDSFTCSNVSQGDTVAVAGRFMYDTECLRYMIEVYDDNHGVFVIEAT